METINRCMEFTCICCSPAKSYGSKDHLNRHRRRFDSTFKSFEQRVAEKYSEELLCETCCNPIPIQKRIRNHATKFCSHSCRAKSTNRSRSIYRRKDRSHRTLVENVCQECAEVFNPSHGLQTFCSSMCRTNKKSKDFIESWLAGEPCVTVGLSKTIRRHLFEKHDHKCQQCNWSERNPVTGNIPLQVDHINGDSTDHRPDNLRLLCPNCHSLTPTFGAINPNKGRQRLRKERRQAP